MTDQEIRIAIATERGWTLEETNAYDGKCWHLNGIKSEVSPPDYHLDLNAMHSAVMSQSPQFRLAFENGMQTAARDLGKLVCEFDCGIHARVFCRVKGIWKD